MNVRVCLLFAVLFLTACDYRPAPNVSLQPQDFGTSGDTKMVDVAANSEGVYTAGFTSGPLGTPNPGGYDAFIRKYNDDGLIWSKQYGTRFYDRAEQIAVDNNGNSYVLGSTGGALGFKVGGFDSFLQKYDSNGVLQWTRQFGTSFDDSGSDVFVDKNSDIYTVSNEVDSTKGVIRKWNSSGALLWRVEAVNEPGNGIPYRRVLAVNTAGTLYMVTPSAEPGIGFAVRLYKFTSAGVAVTGFPKIIYSGGFRLDEALDMKLDGSNNIYMIFSSGGRSGTNRGGAAVLRKTNSNGQWQWTRNLEPEVPLFPNSYGETDLFGLDIDANNNIYVAGSTFGVYNGYTKPVREDSDIVLFKYFPTGTRAWLRQFVTPESEFVSGLALSNDINISGFFWSSIEGTNDSRRDPFLARADLSTGALLSISK